MSSWIKVIGDIKIEPARYGQYAKDEERDRKLAAQGKTPRPVYNGTIYTFGKGPKPLVRDPLAVSMRPVKGWKVGYSL